MGQLNTSNSVALQVIFENEDIYRVHHADVTIAEPVKSEPAEAAPQVFDYFGENNSYFLILTTDPGHAYLNDTELDLLQKTLMRKGLEIRDTAILNILRHPGINFEQLKEYFSCSKLVLFGVNPAAIGLDGISLNVPVEQNGTRILATYSFAEMKDHTGKKTDFWNSMKSF